MSKGKDVNHPYGFTAKSHTIFYDCPLCSFTEFKTVQMKLQHSNTYEIREALDRCIMCKREKKGEEDGEG